MEVNESFPRSKMLRSNERDEEDGLEGEKREKMRDSLEMKSRRHAHTAETSRLVVSQRARQAENIERYIRLNFVYTHDSVYSNPNTRTSFPSTIHKPPHTCPK